MFQNEYRQENENSSLLQFSYTKGYQSKISGMTSVIGIVYLIFFLNLI